MSGRGPSRTYDQGNHVFADQVGQQALAHAITTLGPSNESVRSAWPNALQAALQLGRLDEAHELVALLAEQAPGHVPPYLSAQLARGLALILGAEGRHESVEQKLGSAIGTFGELGYRYWLAVTQTDLAAWLTGQGRGDAAAALLDESIATFESLGAAPALARAPRASRLSPATTGV